MPTRTARATSCGPTDVSLVPIDPDLRVRRPIGHAVRVTFLDGVVGRVGHAAEWVTEAADQLARRYPADDVVVSAAVGWMRVGPQGAPIVDTVFVVTPEVLLFVGNDENVEPARVLLSDVVGLDLLEGLPLPLDAIEIRVVGDLAVLVGWPQDFRDAVLGVLTGGWPPAAPAVDAPSEAATTADEVLPPAAVSVDAAEDLLDTTTESVPVVDPEAPAATLDGERSAPPSPPSPPSLPTAADAGSDVPLIAGRAPSPGPPVEAELPSAVEEPVDAEIVEPAPGTAEASEASDQMDEALDLVLGELPEQLQDAMGDDWPQPIKHVTVLGGTAAGAKRRKHVTLHVDADGLRLTTSGFGSWSLQLAPSDIDAFEVAGVDEVMFTHSLRIGSDAAALFVTQPGGDQVILEIPGTDPHQLRVEMGACLLRWGRGNGSDAVTYF